jgi:hypothetical protein
MNIYALRVSQDRANSRVFIHHFLLDAAFLVRERALDGRHFFVVLLIITVPTYTDTRIYTNLHKRVCLNILLL